MKGFLISFYLVAVVFALCTLVGGCAALPSMRYCRDVVYERHGADVTIIATCTAPVGASL